MKLDPKRQLILNSIRNPPPVAHALVKARREQLHHLLLFIANNGPVAIDVLYGSYALEHGRTTRKIREYLSQLEKADVIRWDRNTDLVTLAKDIKEELLRGLA